MKKLNDFQIGLFSVFKGFRFLVSHRSLMAVAVIPWLINILLCVLLTILFYYNFGDLMNLIMTKPQGWYWLVLYYLLIAIALVVNIFIATFFLCLVGNIIAAPFHEWLCDKTTQIIHQKEKPTSFSWNLKTQFKKLILLLILELFGLLFLLVPFIGPVVSGLITLLLLAYQFMDFPLGAQKLTLSDQCRNFLKFPLMWLGFALGVSILLVIPIANISVLPVGVVSATLLFYQEMLK